jgi:hypothetical protein
LGVERAEGLVEEQHPRLDGQGAGERHALALAATELRGLALGVARQADDAEQLVDLRADLGLGCLRMRKPKGDVLPDAEVLERRVVLEDEADVAPLGRDGGTSAPSMTTAPGVGRLEAAITRSRVTCPIPRDRAGR